MGLFIPDLSNLLENIEKMVPAERIELSWAKARGILSPVRLPVSPRRHLYQIMIKDILKLKNCPPIVNIKMRGAVVGCQWYYRRLLNKFL